MKCISSPKFSFLINGRHQGEVISGRRLRQECPLCPYLFLLCVEGLFALIHDAESRNKLMRFACSKNGPCVSHLFLTDDSLIFCKANKQEFEVAKMLILRYGTASGQVVNFNKSSITFSPNMDHDVKLEIQTTFGLFASNMHAKYLGLPSLTRNSKRHSFHIIKERIWSKLQLWRNKIFSIGGREILVKAIATAIPTYMMGVFKLPVTLSREIQSLIAHFWWGGNGDKRRLHWMN